MPNHTPEVCSRGARARLALRSVGRAKSGEACPKQRNDQIRKSERNTNTLPTPLHSPPCLVAIRGELVRPYGVGRWFFCTLGFFATGSISLENRVRGIAERVSISRPDFHRPVRWFFAIPTFLLTLLFGKLGEARNCHVAIEVAHCNWFSRWGSCAVARVLLI